MRIFCWEGIQGRNARGNYRKALSLTTGEQAVVVPAKAGPIPGGGLIRRIAAALFLFDDMVSFEPVVMRAFSSEVDTGSREENASKQKALAVEVADKAIASTARRPDFRKALADAHQ
jgi:hypothetical protein